MAAGFGTSCATMTGTKKMPPPMTLEMMIAAASSGPRRRSSRAGGAVAGPPAPGAANLLGQNLARDVEGADLHPLRRAVLGEHVGAHVLKESVRQNVGARLRRIAG